MQLVKKKSKSNRLAELFRGLRVAEVIVMSFVLFGGAIIASGHSNSFRPVVGWVLLAISAIVLVVEMKHWVKILPGIFAYGVILSLFPLFSGHVVNHPEKPQSRLQTITIMGAFVVITLVSSSIADRELNRVDRLTLMAFVSFFVWAYVSDSFTALGCAVVSLLVAWAANRITNRRVAAPRPADSSSAAD